MNNQQVQDQLARHLSFLEQDKENLTLLVKISDLYCDLTDFESAQIYLDQANSIDRIACLGHQGLLNLNCGELDKAIENFTEALKYDDTPALRYNLGFCHFVNSEVEEAIKVLSPLMHDEEHAKAKLLMARILHSQGDLDNNFSIVHNVLTNNPEDSEALGLMALLHFDRDENELAEQIAERALHLDPENYDARLIHMLCRLSTQQVAEEEIEQLLEINPNDCRLWFALGSIQMSQGSFENAEFSLRKALEIHPEFYDCYTALGWCLLLHDDLDEAFHTYQEASHLVPELADAWGGLALVHALKDDENNAEHFINKANEINPNCFLTEIAQVILACKKDPLEAKAHLISALKNTQVPASEKLGLILEEMQVTTEDTLH